MARVLIIEGLGWRWECRAGAIADHRATYYAKKAASMDRNYVHEEEYAYGLHDAEELIDWYVNNMDWNDLPPNAIVSVTTPEYATPEQLCKGLERGTGLTYRIEDREIV